MCLRSIINILPLLLPLAFLTCGVMAPGLKYGWQGQVGAGFAIFFVLYAVVMLVRGHFKISSYLLMVPTVVLAGSILYSVDYIPKYGIGAVVFTFTPLIALWLSYWLFIRQVEPLALQGES